MLCNGVICKCFSNIKEELGSSILCQVSANIHNTLSFQFVLLICRSYRTFSSFVVAGLWTMRDFRVALHRLLQSLGEMLEPREVAVETLTFEPVRNAAVKVAIEAGWIDRSSDGHSYTSNEILSPGLSEELSGKQSRWTTALTGSS